jgi:hypothetical protein
VISAVPQGDAAIDQMEPIMNARHSRPTAGAFSGKVPQRMRPRFWSARGALLATIAVTCAATMLAASQSKAGSPHSVIYAIDEGDRDLILRIENSTFPTPPSGSETSPWPGMR